MTLLRKIPFVAVLIAAIVWMFHTPSDATPDGTIRLSFGTFGNPQQIATYRRIVDLFEKEHPNIKVDLRTPSSGGYVEKLRTEMAGHVAPDVTWVDVGTFYGFSEKQVFRPLTEFIKADKDFHLDAYFPGIINAYTRHGDVYALPKSAGSLIVFYNKKHFDESGVPYPTGNWSWDDMLSATAKLMKDVDGDGRIDRYGLVNVDPIGLFAQRKVPIFSDDWRHAFPDLQGTKDLCQFYRDLTYKYKAIPSTSRMGAFGVSTGGTTSGGRGGTSTGVYDLFISENVSMIITDLVLSIKYRTASFDWDVAPQPRFSEVLGHLNGAGYAMNIRTKHPQEAWELIKFVAGPTVQKLRAENGDSNPSMREVAESDTFMKSTLAPANRGAVVAQMVGAQPPPYHPRWNRIQVELAAMFDDIMSEENPTPIDEAIEAARKRIEPELLKGLAEVPGGKAG